MAGRVCHGIKLGEHRSGLAHLPLECWRWEVGCGAVRRGDTGAAQGRKLWVKGPYKGGVGPWRGKDGWVLLVHHEGLHPDLGHGGGDHCPPPPPPPPPPRSLS